MTDLLILLILNSFFIVGFHITTQEGEINSWVDNLLFAAPEWVKKPLYSCPTCMSSLHSIYIFWYNYEFNQANILLYIVYVFALCALNTLVNAAIECFRTNIKQPDDWDKNNQNI